jgi:hypothetical protein
VRERARLCLQPGTRVKLDVDVDVEADVDNHDLGEHRYREPSGNR